MKYPLRQRRTAESGASLMLAVMSLIFLVPMIGLAVDVGMLYVVKARLQGAVDGASLAAARSLNLGQTTAAQATSAKQNAVNWFYANFPPGSWLTNSTLMDTSDTHAHVYDDLVNPNLRHVDVTASSHVPTLFMNWFGVRFTNIVAYGFASRRDVNAMLVMDRSGSMCHSSSPPCTSSDPTCGALIQASKTFTGQFSAGRDKIGAISFADNAYLHSVPTTAFQTSLGYINSFGTGNGELDTIACGGGTATPQAIALAYNELYKINQPGALNVIVVETDGKPNTVTENFWDGAASAIAAGSSCRDANNKTKGQGGFGSSAALPAWTGGHSMNAGGSGYMADIPAGIIGGIGGTDTGTTSFFLFNSWTTLKTNTYSEVTTGGGATPQYSAANGCWMAMNHSTSGSANDLAWMPATDVYGSNLVNPSYNFVNGVSGAHITDLTMNNIRAASFNATDSVATRARTNANLPVTVFAVGFTSTVDDTILQRIANDPDWLPSASCVSSGDCVFNANQPQGTYVFAASTADLIPAFLTLSSQILRLSR
ncbi:MAG: VWA domain-containing protein [Acidobacteriota bacterium]|nr:VWA domain-containing protein [Acidobacteriota bacterium]